MRAIVGLWRWRHNPLRRGTDLLEAWVALAALALIVVAVPVTGVIATQLTRDTLLASVREQREARHAVVGTVLRKVSAPPLDSDPETSSARDSHSRVLARWTGPDGADRQGVVAADLRTPHPGDHFKLWTDERGRVVGRPLDTATATTHAVLAGFGAATAGAALIEGTRRIVLWRMVRGRYARWDRAWDRAGPDWGRTGTGS
ncbi:Rv1733c family protein [Streptomyces flavofungini]|uniref:Rv1733c family protein n=1 Tax=Streptomyces flavofungini TaxID=68200 RepID=UPI0034DF2DB0